MAPTESITAIAKLLETLIHQSRDAKTLALIKQIETPYRALEAAYLEAEHKALDHHGKTIRLESENGELRRRIANMEDKDSNEVVRLQGQIQELEVRLKKSNSQALADWFKEKTKQQAEFNKRQNLDHTLY